LILLGLIVSKRMPRHGDAELQGADMPEESFYCPHCNRHTKKSTQAYLIGESMAVGGTFVVMGGMPETLRCPGLRGRHRHEEDVTRVSMTPESGRAGRWHQQDIRVDHYCRADRSRRLFHLVPLSFAHSGSWQSLRFPSPKQSPEKSPPNFQSFW